MVSGVNGQSSVFVIDHVVWGRALEDVDAITRNPDIEGIRVLGMLQRVSGVSKTRV